MLTTTVLNTKTGEVGNKTPDHAKYITVPEFNTFAVSIIVAILK